MPTKTSVLDSGPVESNSNLQLAYLVPAVDRALRILHVLVNSQEGLSLSDIATELGIPKSSTHNLLYTLARHRFVERTQSGNWTLALGVFEVGAAFGVRTSLSDVFRESARAIVAACGETVQLAVLDGRDIVYIAKVDGTQSVRLVSHEGTRLPAHATALGKAMLASLSTAEVEQLYHDSEWPKLTPRTITSIPDLVRELIVTRDRGYAIDNEEVAAGLKCIACPVINTQGQTLAAVSVSVPSYRMTLERFAELRNLIAHAAAEISSRVVLQDAEHLRL